jgi:dipeptide transport system ATP-binding protein
MSLLEAVELSKQYPVGPLFGKKREVHALTDLSFRLDPGETLAVVGESGCGKSTLARLLLGIEAASAGEVLWEGKPARTLSPAERRRNVQMIFQDPTGSLNPRKRAWEIVAEPLRINARISKEKARAEAIAILQRVGLRAEQADRYPHMFSGGQRQRIGIARALMLRPRVLVCDEPVSALDVSIQAQILNLLKDLQEEFRLSYVFISHDLSVVRYLADRVLVLYLGRAVEEGPASQVLTSPRHPYTQALLASTPKVSFEGAAKPQALRGELPSPLSPPSGCAFHKRCPIAEARCSEERPRLDERGVACHFA